LGSNCGSLAHRPDGFTGAELKGVEKTLPASSIYMLDR
jgi:hypothetical protein